MAAKEHAFPAGVNVSAATCGGRFSGVHQWPVLGVHRGTSGTAEAPAAAALERKSSGQFAWRFETKSGATRDLQGALWNLEAALCQAIIHSQRRSIAVHAAVVFGDSRTALLAGRSGAGKSTLSVALSRRGVVLATDDVTLVEPGMMKLLPIPRCFHLDDHSVELLEKDGFRFPRQGKRFRFMAPGDPGTGASLPELLIFLSASTSEQPRLAAVSQAEMVARLLSETGRGPLADGETVGVLSRLASRASCYTLVPGPLSATADLLADLIRRERE